MDRKSGKSCAEQTELALDWLKRQRQCCDWLRASRLINFIVRYREDRRLRLTVVPQSIAQYKEISNGTYSECKRAGEKQPLSMLNLRERD